MMRSLFFVGSVGMAKASNDTAPIGIDFNMTEAEWAENQAVFNQNMEEYEQSNYESTVDVSRGMTKCNQLCSEWCWATCATMVSSVFSSISSGECNTYEARAASMKTHYSCDGKCSRGCDQPGQPEDIMRAIQQFSGAYYSKGNSLSQQQLDSALQSGPVVLLIRWNSGNGGHAITCSGGSRGQYQIHDPEGQDKILSYGQIMRYENQGTWVQSVYSYGGGSNGLSVQV